MQIVGDLSNPHMAAQQAEALLSHYKDADVILEYGSGGSTALACSLPGKLIFSVDNDPAFVDLMALRLSETPSEGLLHFEDLGPCAKWGRPLLPPSREQVTRYATSVWQRPDFKQPDVVLIDGRCRAACFLAVAGLTTEPVTVLFDDWVGRSYYHEVARYGVLLAMDTRMAVFKVFPSPGLLAEQKTSPLFLDTR